MKKTIPVMFVIIATLLAIIFFSRKTLSKTSNSNIPSLVTADSQEKKNTTEEKNVTIVEENTPTSFLTLKSDETLLSSMGIDLNNDSLDDEILITKRASNPRLIVVLGIYNPTSKMYVRVAEIQTEITQFRSFSYNGIDVTGEHKTALVFQGFSDNSMSVLQMYFCNGTAENFRLEKIGDFKSDGTIFIQQFNRTDTYELAQSSGKSFPVWVYSSDTSNGAQSLSQIQTEYDWNPAARKYVQTRQIKVEGRNLAAKELEKIQDGTVKTFANYLDGLWYKVSGKDKNIHYIYFNYDTSEVIFIEGETQEVFSWITSSLYKNGIYISTSNISIENLGRRFAVTLTDIDQIRIRVYDDVRMHIGADSLWDGQYKRLTDIATFTKDSSEDAKITEIKNALENATSWYTADGADFVFKNGTYSLSTDEFNENGVVAFNTIDDKVIIQFNSKSKSKYVNESYFIGFKENPRTIKLKNGKESTVIDKDLKTIIMQPATIFASEVLESTGKVIMLNAEK